MSHAIPSLKVRINATLEHGQGETLRLIRRSLVPMRDDPGVEAWIHRFSLLLDAGAYESAAIMLTERAIPDIWWITAKGRSTETEPLYATQLLFGHEVVAVAEHDVSLAMAFALATLEYLEKQL